MLALVASIERKLRLRARRNLKRVLTAPAGVDFSSNDYLCLANHPRIVKSVKRAVTSYGYGSTSSRFIRGERDFYASTEQEFARFKSSEAALFFQSGYAANIGALSSVIKRGDMVLSDQLNHASIIDGLALSGAHIKIFDHINVDDLYTKACALPAGVNKYLVTESLFSMDGDVAPLDKYAQLCREHGINLIVDEAHAVGLFGNNGSGLIEHFGVDSQVLLSINGLGKAFGCVGAMVCGPESVVEYVKQNARTLMYSTALPPLSVAAVQEALKIIENGARLRQRLFANVAYLQKQLISAKLMHDAPFLSPIFPIVVKDTHLATALSHILFVAGFDVKAIRPPSVPINSARLRITTNVGHSFKMLDELTNILRANL